MHGEEDREDGEEIRRTACSSTAWTMATYSYWPDYPSAGYFLEVKGKYAGRAWIQELRLSGFYTADSPLWTQAFRSKVTTIHESRNLLLSFMTHTLVLCKLLRLVSFPSGIFVISTSFLTLSKRPNANNPVAFTSQTHETSNTSYQKLTYKHTEKQPKYTEEL